MTTKTTTRREFLKNAAILSGAAGLSSVLPFSIKRAMAINAEKGTTFLDAEHVVFLMQENRSFDHIFGTMKGVRGFNDPRAKTLPSGDKVWIQRDKDGKAYPPFHIDIQKTKVTWEGGLPHGWPDQSAARNRGKYDQWIPNKTAMTMGHYQREDVPFYYAMADAFTICDHNFCSSLTGTTPNRLFFWTGNIRPDLKSDSVAAVLNSFAESRDNAYVDWSTFPELLEDNDISWKIYQNELWTANLQPSSTDYWLGNYGDNAIEYVTRHNVKLSAYFRKNGDKSVKPDLSPEQVQEKYAKLSAKQKNLVDKAFTTNIDDTGDYLRLAPFTFTDDKGKKWTIEVPKNDIFHQFRQDVQSGQLPTVSWLVAPQSFSDHTSSPLYGTWYVSQVLDILTQNPEVWKKTIFILNYDENDGYFDHLSPFVVPKPGDPHAGKVSESIDTLADYHQKDDAPIGLGYRVPMIICSPWSKGGYVNSQVTDHTSTLMFLENFLSKKTGKQIRSPHISSWRRAICSDLFSAFRPYNGEQVPLPDFLNKDASIIRIQNAKNKPRQLLPDPLTDEDRKLINGSPSFDGKVAGLIPHQESGIKNACALPMQLFAHCIVDKDTGILELSFASSSLPGIDKNSIKGAPFNMYTTGKYKGEAGKVWNYAVSADRTLYDQLLLRDFADGAYALKVDGPNGFFREFTGSRQDPQINIQCQYEKNGKKISGNIALEVENKERQPIEIELLDNAYKTAHHSLVIGPGQRKTVIIALQKQHHWYDFTLRVNNKDQYARRFAGHVETGKPSMTDPYMGGIV
ncbi:phospholipase C, phosphocholine-specific [Arachidicoccus terrestris]|nr:phospholipase C, phosphocholine-specific [Arachidicoccus terrestris]